jgi:hypothetical protein
LGNFYPFAVKPVLGKMLGIFSYIGQLSAWRMGNGQNKKAAPSCYTAGLITAFEGFY